MWKREWVACWKDKEMAERLEEKAVLRAVAVARAFEEGAEKELATFVAVDAAQAASMAKVLCK